MQPPVTEDRENDGDQARNDGPDWRTSNAELFGGRTEHVATKDNVAPVNNESHEPDGKCAISPELRAALNQLREPEVRTLSCVSGHRCCANHRSDGEGYQSPTEVESGPDADGTGCHAEKVSAAGEPDGCLVSQQTFAFVRGHVIDRARFDLSDKGRIGSSVCHDDLSV
ncbi:unannotated protein [freshwater metagenome]|uniref:Unannotated protein n=1 Tax=freshwater metagenome TaxID=449393 RepID=A0A6J6JAD5_9ZZZZ